MGALGGRVIGAPVVERFTAECAARLVPVARLQIPARPRGFAADGVRRVARNLRKYGQQRLITISADGRVLYGVLLAQAAVFNGWTRIGATVYRGAPGEA